MLPNIDFLVHFYNIMHYSLLSSDQVIDSFALMDCYAHFTLSMYPMSNLRIKIICFFFEIL